MTAETTHMTAVTLKIPTFEVAKELELSLSAQLTENLQILEAPKTLELSLSALGFVNVQMRRLCLVSGPWRNGITFE